MTIALTVACGVLGLLVGSFLNVVVWRVPRGESVVSPPSSCPSCGSRIRPWDNVPVVSWLLLRRRCRFCASRISARYPLVELGTGLAFAGVAAAVPGVVATGPGVVGTVPDVLGGVPGAVGTIAAVPALLYLAAVSIALALIDIDVHRLPNAIVLPSYLVGAALLAAPSIANGDYAQLVRAAIGTTVLYALYFALVVVYPGGMGFGDVKLAGVLGMYLAWVGWPALVVGAFLAFLIGGMFGLALMAAQRAGRKSRIPFGPFMLLGAWIGIIYGDDIARGYLSIIGL